jgi:uncharacterized protein YndB with AHSA1/START domain
MRNQNVATCEGPTMAIQDSIEREMVLRATRSQVWAALTTAEGLAGWWCDAAEVDLRPGGALVIDFGSEHGVSHATIVAVEPEERFVTTWRPFEHDEGGDQIPPDVTTQIEFRLEDHALGTLLKLRETGFAALPDAIGKRNLHENEGGWDTVLAWLRIYLATGEKSRLP